MKTHSLATVIAAALIPAGFALVPAGFALAQGANDCASAQPTKGYGAFPFTTVGATTDGTADALCNFFSVAQIYNDVWFRFTAPATTVVDVGNCGASTLDSKIAIYGGADCAAPVIACSDDSCGTQSKCTFAVTAGSSYLIRVGGLCRDGHGHGNDHDRSVHRARRHHRQVDGRALCRRECDQLDFLGGVRAVGRRTLGVDLKPG